MERLAWGRIIRKHKRTVSLGVGSITLIKLVKLVFNYYQQLPPHIPFSDFLLDLRSGVLKEVIFGTNELFVVSTHGSRQRYRTSPIASYNREQLLKELVSFHVTFDVSKEGYLDRLKKLLLVAIPFIYLSLIACIVHRIQNPKEDTTIGKKTYYPTTTTNIGASRFEDVAGMDDAKKELSEIVEFMENPQKFRLMGCKMPRGVLLSGPPGVGKTLLAKALAQEANIPFFSACASEFVETLVGRGARRVRDLFEKARNEAPCIVFIDEIDALGKTRGGLNSNDEREQTLNQILTELDGIMVTKNSITVNDTKSVLSLVADLFTSKPPSLIGNILVVAATNRIQILDPALTRAGRFDRHISIALPNLQDRLAILKHHTKHVPFSIAISSTTTTSSSSSRQLSPHSRDRGNTKEDFLEALARQSSGFSGADLENAVNEAALLAVRADSKTVLESHFEEALQKQAACMRNHTSNMRK